MENNVKSNIINKVLDMLNYYNTKWWYVHNPTRNIRAIGYGPSLEVPLEAVFPNDRRFSKT